MPVQTAGTALGTFATEVVEYLRRTPRELPSKYFYDALGSALFEAICHLPWYRVTRAETALLARHAREILGPLGRPLSIAELGCGNGEKLATFASAAEEPFTAVALVDISPAALDTARRRIELLDAGPVRTLAGTYEQGLAALGAHPVEAPRLVLFLGSNIGNFEPEGARALLAAVRRSLPEGGALLLGTDLVKPVRDLLLAYDDPLQVTAAFNRNLLRRINEELGGTFDLEAWAHRAIWNADDRRVEMHLVSRARQRVSVASAGLDLTFEAGEWIRTESSYKYRPADVVGMGVAAGFRASAQWVDSAAGFALTRFSV